MNGIIVNYYNKYKNNKFVRNVLTLFSGSSISFIITFIVLLFLTRIYSKDILDIFFLYSVIVGTLSIATTLQLELSIVLPKKSEDAENLFFLTIIVSLITSSILFLLIYFFYENIASFLSDKDKSMGVAIYFIPLGTFFTGINKAYSYLSNSKKNYKVISKANIYKSTISSVLQLFFAFIKSISFALINGLLLGQLFSILFFINNSRKERVNIKNSLTFFDRISIKRMLYLIKKYKKIPTLNTLISFINSLSNMLPAIIFLKFFGLEYSGYYLMTQKAVAGPMSIFSMSVGQVFYKEFVDRHNNNNSFLAFVKKSYLSLLKIGIIPYILLFVSSLTIFGLIFGAEWEETGKVTAILIPWFLIGFVNMPLTSIITVLNKQDKMIFYEFLLLLFRTLSIFAGYYIFDSFYISLSLFSLTGVIFNSFLITYILRITKKAEENCLELI